MGRSDHLLRETPTDPRAAPGFLAIAWPWLWAWSHRLRRSDFPPEFVTNLPQIANRATGVSASNPQFVSSQMRENRVHSGSNAASP